MSYDGWFLGLAAIAVAVGIPLIVSLAKKDDRIMYSMILVLAIAVLGILCANLSNADSCINFRPDRPSSEGHSTNPPAIPSETPSPSYEAITSDLTTEPVFTASSTEYLMPTDPAYFTDSASMPLPQRTPYATTSDAINLPYAWTHNESEWYVLNYFADTYNEDYDPIIFDDHFCYLASKFDPEMDVEDEIIIDYLDYYDSTASNASEPPYPHSEYVSYYNDYRAIYFRFHYAESLDYISQFGYGFTIFDSAGEYMPPNESYVTNYVDGDSGYIVLLLPPEFQNDQYLLVFNVCTFSETNDPSLYLMAYFMLDLT